MLIKQATWTQLKAFADARGLSVQWIDYGETYWIAAIDGALAVETKLDKIVDAIDVADFELTRKTPGNRALQPLDSDKRSLVTPSAFSLNLDYKVRAKGYSSAATLGATTNHNFAVGAEDRYMNGLVILLKDHVFGDTMALQVVDVDNLLGFGAGAMLNEFGTSWNVAGDQQNQGLISFPYNAKINAGLYLRVVYTSTGTVEVKVRVNFLLHKKVT